jgi:hypothetical protein
MKLLFSDKAPYLLTILFSIIAIQFNYTVNSILKVPIIEYSFQTETSLDSIFSRKMTLKNISTDKVIKDFHIQLVFGSRSNSVITEPKIDPVPPATIVETDPKSTDNKLAYYPIAIIQPQMSYELKFKSNNTADPKFFFATDEPIRMKASSASTFVIRNHIEINVFLMLLFMVLAIFYVLKTKRVS